MIGIIDYGMGNLRSVQKALEQLGAEAVILSSVEDGGGAELDRVKKLVLPGVGAFGDGMAQLRERGWIEPVKGFIGSGRPFLGICLGLQLLFDGSEEDAVSDRELVPGLGMIKGKVVRFRQPAERGKRRLKVPHMGWNTITWSRRDPLLAGLKQGSAVYFVHSYFVRPVETAGEPVVSAVSDYGGEFCATIWKGNVWGTQFHPEKSQDVGLAILRNFVAM